MHGKRTLLCLQSAFVLPVLVCLWLSASNSSAISLQAKLSEDVDRNLQEDESSIKMKVDGPEGYNEIIEKLNRVIKEQPQLYPDNHIHRTPEEDPPVSPESSSIDSESEANASFSKQAEQLPSSSHRTNAHRARMEAPKYMLELYHKFSTDKYSHPMANIVRSFTNINEEISDPLTRRNGDNAVAADAAAAFNSSRVHRMLFNVTSIGRDEEIYLAELRLFTLVEADRNLYNGINRRVSVSEVIPIHADAHLHSSGTETRLEMIVSKEIYGRHSGWETIPITDALRRWVRQRSNVRGDIHMLEVRIDTVGRLKEEPSDATPAPPIVDVNTRPHNENEPLLLVFSNDRHRRLVYESMELDEMLAHEMELVERRPYEEPEVEYEYYEGESEDGDYEEPINFSGRRRKKRTAEGIGSRERMGRKRRVATEAAEEEEEDAMEHFHDSLTAEEYPSEMAKRLQMTGMNDTTGSSEGDDDNYGDFRFQVQNGRLADKRRRVRRSKKKRTRRDICRRKPMFVDFEDIRWNEWVIAPLGYQAYECTGRCYFPLSDHLTPTKHSIIQTMLNQYHPTKASPTCCVPSKLDPISILYIDDQGVVTYKYKYEGMVVAECGCR